MSVIFFASGCVAPTSESPRILLSAQDPAIDPTAEVIPNRPTTTVEFQPDAFTFATEVVNDELDTPVYVTHAGDGSSDLYVLEKEGKIRIVRNGTLIAEPFLDISGQVTTGGNEQGLLGLAFAPDYSASGYFFVHYSDNSGDTVVARFQRTDNLLKAAVESEFVILQLEQPARNHNGGMLTFGPDQYLYIGMGDGGASGDRYDNGQNPATMLGKMLRIDVLSE